MHNDNELVDLKALTDMLILIGGPKPRNNLDFGNRNRRASTSQHTKETYIDIKENEWFSNLVNLEIDSIFYRKLINALKATIVQFKQDYKEKLKHVNRENIV